MAIFLERALAWVNRALAGLFDIVFSPILGLPPLVSLMIVSLVTAAAMLPVVARTSDQKRLAGTKRRIHAALFEIRLFNDDLAAVLQALADALRHQAIYLRLSLVPLAWMAVPLALVVAHLHAFYGYRGLRVGEPALVTVEVRHAAGQIDASAGAVLNAPPEVRVDTDAVRLSAVNEVLWRIVPGATGEYVLTVRLGEATATKTLHVSDRAARRSPRRVSAGLLDQWLFPSETPLFDAGPIAAIAVSYPEPGLDVLGWRVHWMIVYAVLSMASALALARRFGITL